MRSAGTQLGSNVYPSSSSSAVYRAVVLMRKCAGRRKNPEAASGRRRPIAAGFLRQVFYCVHNHVLNLRREHSDGIASVDAAAFVASFGEYPRRWHVAEDIVT